MFSRASALAQRLFLSHGARERELLLFKARDALLLTERLRQRSYELSAHAEVSARAIADRNCHRAKGEKESNPTFESDRDLHEVNSLTYPSYSTVFLSENNEKKCCANQEPNLMMR